MSDKSVLTKDFKTTRFWWEAYRPEDADPAEVPASTGIAIIGEGYAGLSCALELASGRRSVTILEASVPGIGASTRSGGQVTGRVNIGKALSGRHQAGRTGCEAQLLGEASLGYRFLEDILEKHQITCGYHKTGRLTVAWTSVHLRIWSGKLEKLNRLTDADVRVLTPDELRGEIASDFYFGGLLMNAAGHIHPALYLGGLLRAAKAQGAVICSQAPVSDIQRKGSRFRIATGRGEILADEVVIASNAYTGPLAPGLRRGLIPVTTHMIATEKLPEELAASLIPRNRAVAETRRVVNHYKMSPNGRRLLFRCRARFTSIDERASARILRKHDGRALSAARRDPDFPQLGRPGRHDLRLPLHIGTQDGIHYALG
jgi:glycine/D-amino acid oxidase-like deaminating enzyme